MIYVDMISKWMGVFLAGLLALAVHAPTLAEARLCEATFSNFDEISLGAGVGGEASLKRGGDGALVVEKRYFLPPQLANDVAVLDRLQKLERGADDFYVVRVLSSEKTLLHTEPIAGTALHLSMSDPALAAAYRERLARLAASLRLIGVSARLEGTDTLLGGWKEGYEPRLMMIKPDNVILGADGRMTIVDPY